MILPFINGYSQNNPGGYDKKEIYTLSNQPTITLTGRNTEYDGSDITIIYFDPLADTVFNKNTDALKLMNNEPTLPNI